MRLPRCAKRLPERGAGQPQKLHLAGKLGKRAIFQFVMGISETLQRRMKRLRSMGRDELVDRLRQNAQARIDGAKYRLGREVVSVPALAPAQERPQFFFSAESIPCLCALLKERLPEATVQIVQRAKIGRAHV